MVVNALIPEFYRFGFQNNVATALAARCCCAVCSVDWCTAARPGLVRWCACATLCQVSGIWFAAKSGECQRKNHQKTRTIPKGSTDRDLTMQIITLLLFNLLSTAALASALSPTSTTPPSVADCIGLRVAVTDKGLKYVSSIAIPLLEKQLASIALPDVPFSEDGFEGSISSITCTNFLIGGLTLNANADPLASVHLAATGVALSCTASWQYKLSVWPHFPYGDGSVDITIGDSSGFSGTLGMSNNTGVFTSLSLPACTAAVSVSNIDFSGGISGDILNLFKSLIKTEIEKEVNGQVCGAIKTALVTDVNPLLVKPPADFLACTVLGKSVVCDVSAGSVNPNEPPIPVPALPVPDPTAAPTHDILIMMDMTPFNYAMYLLWDAGIFDIIVSGDMIPPNFPQILNTSNFNDIAPGMFKKWPNLAMQLEINVTQAPSFQVVTPATPAGNTHTAFSLDLPTDIIFQVLDPATGLQNAFDVHCPFTAAVSVDVMTHAVDHSQTINGSLSELGCTVSLVNTNVGNVSVSQLQGIVSLVTLLVEPMINKKLQNMSIPIPSLGPVNLTNSEVAFIEEGQYLLIASDVVLALEKNESSGRAFVKPCDVGCAVGAMKELSSLTRAVTWLYGAMGFLHVR